MKIGKIILYVVIVLIVIGAILTFVAPTHVKIERSIIINSSKEEVFKNLRYYSNRAKWSPWLEKDPQVKTSIEGTDGEVGAIYKWEGNKDVGKGLQTIMRIEDMQKIEDKLQFLEPFKSEADAYLQMGDSAGMVKVSWGFISESPRPFNIFNLFMDMDKMVGPDFQNGLSKLKMLCESEANNAPQQVSVSYQVQEIQWPGKTYIGKKGTVTWDKISEFYQSNLSETFKALGIAQAAMDGAPSGLYFVWDTVEHKTEMAAAIPVKDLKKEVKGFEKFEIKAGKVLQVTHNGSYDKIGDAHNAIAAYIKEKGYKELSPVIEEYVTDPSGEKDTSKWLTNIYYFVE